MARFLFGGVGLIADLLPHLHRRDGQLGLLGLPGWIPLILPGQEILGCSLRLVNPRLTGRAVFEPTIGTSHSQIDDEVELLIKRRVQVGVVDPWVGESGPVGIGQRKLPTSPKILVERVVEDLQETGVDVGEEVLLTPLHTISVFTGGVSSVES